MGVCMCPIPVDSGEYILDNGVNVPKCSKCGKAIITRDIGNIITEYNRNEELDEEPDR